MAKDARIKHRCRMKAAAANIPTAEPARLALKVSSALASSISERTSVEMWSLARATSSPKDSSCGSAAGLCGMQDLLSLAGDDVNHRVPGVHHYHIYPV